MDSVITLERPFYYHTDYEYLNIFFDAVSFIVHEEVTIFPKESPPNAELWIDEYAKAQYQGCGHVRLMISNPDLYGLANNTLPKIMLSEMIRWYWNASVEEQHKLDFTVVKGALDGKAIASISVNGTCKLTPAYPPQNLGSSVFIYHHEAVSSFRAEVLAPFFKEFDPSIDLQQFKTQIEDLAALQLAASLSASSPGLPPANQVNIYSFVVEATAIEVPVSEDNNVPMPVQSNAVLIGEQAWVMLGLALVLFLVCES